MNTQLAFRAALVVVITGATPPVSGQTSAGAPPQPDFEACPSGRGPAWCGSIEVPEDHHPRGRTAEGRSIGLQVRILPGRAEGAAAPPPVYILAGGPGQAAQDLEGLVVSRFGSRLPDRDLVFVDQRGTGGSNPLSCTTGALDDPSRFFGPAYTEAELEACLAELGERADVRLYTTEQFADDLVAVADALGHEQFDVLGGSYGTKAALVLMRRHPERVASAVLEGVAPPSFLNPLPHARGSQDVLDAVFAECAASAPCATAYPDLATRFAALLDRLERDPPAVTVPGSSTSVPLERGVMTYLTHLLLFNDQSRSIVPALIHSVDQGDYRLLTTLQGQVVAGVVSGIDFGLQLSVTCTENVPSFGSIDLDARTANTYLGRDMVDGITEECARWPAGTVSPGFLDPVTAPVPTLLITGGLDPATPPDFGREVAGQLPRSRLVEIPRGAHITAHPCVDGLITAFLRERALDRLDTDCVASIRHPAFQILPGGAGR